MVDAKLVEFVREARRRGFSDTEIVLPLRDEGWSKDDIDEAFASVRGKKGKMPITFSVDDDVYSALRKRAKKNMLTVEQQVEDIVRRSMVNTKSAMRTPEKLDDLLVAIFSRKKH